MADQRRRKTWPGEKDDDDDRTKIDEQGESDGDDEKHDPKNEESFEFIVSPNPVGDNGGSVPTIGWARAKDDDETEII